MSKSEPSILVLPEILAAETIEEIHHWMDEQMQPGQPLVMDMSNVKRISAAGIQLLLVADLHGSGLRLKGMSEPLIDLCFATGLDEALGRWCGGDA